MLAERNDQAALALCLMPYALHLVLAERNDGAALGRDDVVERLMPDALCLMPYSSTPRVGGAK